MDGSGDLLGIGGVGDEDEDEIEEGKLHDKIRNPQETHSGTSFGCRPDGPNGCSRR